MFGLFLLEHWKKLEGFWKTFLNMRLMVICKNQKSDISNKQGKDNTIQVTVSIMLYEHGLQFIWRTAKEYTTTIHLLFVYTYWYVEQHIGSRRIHVIKLCRYHSWHVRWVFDIREAIYLPIIIYTYLYAVLMCLLHHIPRYKYLPV